MSTWKLLVGSQGVESPGTQTTSIWRLGWESVNLPLISPHTKYVYGLYRDIFGIRQPRCYVIYFRDGGSVVSAIENPSIYIGKFRSKRVAKHGETLKADRRM